LAAPLQHKETRAMAEAIDDDHTDDPNRQDMFRKFQTQNFVNNPDLLAALSEQQFMSAFPKPEKIIVTELMTRTGLEFREVVSRALQEMLERTPKV
jgi:phenylpropionate dioxygenase-like ring-hydroxylating dioxygenase large terminal subunit